jgi:hypothetical protein
VTSTLISESKDFIGIIAPWRSREHARSLGHLFSLVFSVIYLKS